MDLTIEGDEESDIVSCVSLRIKGDEDRILADSTAPINLKLLGDDAKPISAKILMGLVSDLVLDLQKSPITLEASFDLVHGTLTAKISGAPILRSQTNDK